MHRYIRWSGFVSIWLLNEVFVLWWWGSWLQCGSAQPQSLLLTSGWSRKHAGPSGMADKKHKQPVSRWHAAVSFWLWHHCSRNMLPIKRALLCWHFFIFIVIEISRITISVWAVGLLLTAEEIDVRFHSSYSQSQRLMQVLVWESWSFFQLHAWKSVLTDICAIKNSGHLHCVLSYVGAGLVWEGSIVLCKTVGVECVFQQIAGLQLSQFKLKRR